MAMAAERALRTDAARNADRILRAARDVYAEFGPDAPIDVIARRAGVGERTLYRRFPSKADLVRAALDQSIAENLTPALTHAVDNPDPLQGLAELIGATTAFGAREHNILVVARRVDALANVTEGLEGALADLTERAQAAGLVRADLVADDLSRIIMMLNSVLWTMDPATDGWQRYVALMIDAISTADGRPLPPAVPMRFMAAESWPL
ncbi:MAG: helix-turn-helix domain-containing protein [Mycobacterium sp.]